MADTDFSRTLAARSALDGYRERLAAAPGAVAIDVLPSTRQFNVRIDTSSGAVRALEAVLGSPLPGALSWSATADGANVVWLGPDEWLLLEPVGSSSSEDALRSAVGDDGAVTEQSGQRLSLLLSGDVAALLAKGTGLNLTAGHFPAGTALQGFLGQAVVTYLSRADDSSRIELLVRTSFARYVADWLLDAVSDPLAYPAASGR